MACWKDREVTKGRERAVTAEEGEVFSELVHQTADQIVFTPGSAMLLSSLFSPLCSVLLFSALYTVPELCCGMLSK